jgi:hypothetical protein
MAVITDAPFRRLALLIQSASLGAPMPLLADTAAPTHDTVS